MSKTKIIIIAGVGGVVFLALALFLILGGLGGTKAPERVTLQFWGVFDESIFYRDVFSDFERANPRVKIIYRKFNFEDYEKQLVDSFAAGTGPDIWLTHNSWLPKHGDKIQPLPSAPSGKEAPLFTVKDFREQFVDAAAEDLISGNNIFGLPLYLDTLALYYNKDIFNTTGIASPPSTWQEFIDIVPRLTQLDSRDNVIKSAAALGTARNINRSTDTLSLLMLQSGVQMTSQGNTGASFSRPVQNQNVGEIALQFYTDFANPSKRVYTWNDQQHYSIDAFLNGETAMMLNYSHQILTLRGKSPRFNFAIAPAPQLEGAPVKVNYANYWAATVSKQSKNSRQAWEFLVFLTSRPSATKYLIASDRPSARRDLIQQQQTDPDLGVFAQQALSARSWYQADNSAIEKIFAEMIENVNFGRASVKDALNTAESQVTVLMARSRR